MATMGGRWARGVVVVLAGAALAVGGCTQGMMGEKKMMDKEPMKDDMMKDKETMEKK